MIWAAVIWAAVIWAAVMMGPTLHAQGRSRSNVKQIDPVRVGDEIEVKYASTWYPGSVLLYADGKASVKYTFHGRETTGDFGLDDMRFPNGEGHWVIWKDASGKFKIEARYITRDEQNVTLRKADGNEVQVPIAKLAVDLRKRVKLTPIPGEENKVNGAVPVKVGDQVQAKWATRWYDGEIKAIFPGEVEVDYVWGGSHRVAKFKLEDVRFPNGEGPWREWSDVSGKFKIIARYLSRTEKDVTIRREDGSDVTIPIAQLAPKLRRALAQTVVTGKENLIDGVNPVRNGDRVEFQQGFRWISGVVVGSSPGKIAIQYDFGSSKSKTEVELEKVRFPNNEGHWRKWSDSSGEFSIIARYLARNATHVMLIKEDGATISVPIERLNSRLQKMLKDTLAVTRKPPKIQFAMSPSVTSFLSTAPDFTNLVLPSTELTESVSMPEGGFGFQLTHSNHISAVVPTGGPDPWVVVGSYPDSYIKTQPVAQVHWTRPGEQKVVPGPNFHANEQVVDYSASQQRMITVQMSEGHWKQPEMFCSYRVKPGGLYATPEARWDIAEKKSSWGRGTNYRARLVGENQLLLADGNAVSLYDFQSNRVVYTLSGLAGNHFDLHPSRKYFVVALEAGGLSMHATETGATIAKEPSGKGAVGFSQDGNELIHVGDGNVTIWDLRQNAPPRVLQSRNLLVVNGSALTLINDQWLWANSSIYNMEREIVVWSYSGSGVQIEHSQMLGSKMLVAATAGSAWDKKTALVGIAQVPHQSAIDELSKMDTDTMIMLKSGSGIRIDAPGDSRIRSGLQRAIAANGWHEDPSSEIVLTGSAGPGKSQTMTYESSRFGFGRSPASDRGPTTVTATPWTQRVSISFRGQSAWNAGSGGSLPFSMFLRGDETVQSKVNESAQPRYDLFEKLKIPAEMLYPQFRYGLGRTLVTASGFKDELFDLAPTGK